MYTLDYSAEYKADIRKMIQQIEEDYSYKQIIKPPWESHSKFRYRILLKLGELIGIFTKKDSLAYMMGICGHCSETQGDYDDLFYNAGAIILIVNHKYYFHDHYHIYKLMKDMSIPLDKQNRKHYHKAKKEYQRFCKG